MRRSLWENLLWGRGGRIYSSIATPVSTIYGAAALLRAKLYQKGIFHSHRPETLTVSVGNLTPGGAGKTPLVLALAEAFTARGLNPVIITRGYGGSDKRRAVLVPRGADPSEVGDEPAMMTAMMPDVPLIKSPRRKHGAKLAEAAFKPDVLLLDDAFGHLAIARDFDIIAVDAQREFGNGKPIPAGPLREPISALKRVDCVVVTVADASELQESTRIRAAVKEFAPHADMMRGTYRATGLVNEAGGVAKSAGILKGRKVVAFSGIGNPETFNLMLEKLGAQIAAKLNFPDHHDYSRKNLEAIARAVVESSADFAVTTEKDLTRLGNRRPPVIKVVALRISLEVERIEWLIDRILGKRQGTTLSQDG